MKPVKMYCIGDSTEDHFWGPYTKQPLAEKVLKIVKKAVDSEAKIHEVECDEFESQIMAGLMPIKITLEILGGTIQEPTFELTWPPAPEEGITMFQDHYREYFFWAQNRTEAKLKMARCKLPEPEPIIAAEAEEEEEMLI